MTIDGNGRRVACDPYNGTVEAVLEAVANLACVGAEPLGLTNCLNFGNPEKPTVAWQLDRSTQALADACNELGIPVVGGNVSLYNETESGPIYPTPVVGLVGELPDPAKAGGIALREGDAIALVGPFKPSLAGSELAKQRGELGPGLPVPDVAACAEAAAQVREWVREGKVTAAHDISDGGLACALAEMAIAGGVGVRVDAEALQVARGGDSEAWLFGEGAGGLLLAGPEETIASLPDNATWIGSAAGSVLEIGASGAPVTVGLDAARAAWQSLPERFSQTLIRIDHRTDRRNVRWVRPELN